MRHSAAAPPVRSVRAAGSPLFAVTVALALLSVGFFGYGVFLHTAAKPNLNAAAKPTPIVGAAHSKPLPHTRHSHHTVVGKPKSSPLSATTSPPTALFGLTGPGNDLAFGAMLAGGIGLLLSALAGLGLSHQTRTTQSQTIQSSLRAEYAAWEKQRSVLDTQREALSAQLQEAQQNKAEIDKLRHHASRQFQEFFRTLPVACFCFAADGKIVRWNAACETLYGLPASEAMDSTLWTSVVPADEREAMTEWMQRVLAGDSVLDVERRDQNSAGTTFPLRCSMVPLYGAEGEIIGGLSAGIDLSEIKQYTQHISALETALSQARTELSQIRAAWEAHTLETARLQSHLLEAAPQRVIEEIADAAAPSRDLLTGLYTQEAFQDRLRAEAERAHRYNTSLSVIVLDMDGFGAYNQAHGSVAGDQALQSVASLIESKIRTVDIAARCEGDTYALILPETSEAGTRVAADRLRSGIAGLDWAQQPLTACFGAALLTPDVSSSDILLTQALESLRRAKSLGPSTVVYHGDAPFPAIRKSRRKEMAAPAG